MTQHEEQAHERERPGPTLGGAADRLARSLPGYRVEILQGRLIATPWADGAHALALS
ncbi:hypothetical protein ACF07T_11175 [Streptomyces sp. NPDC015184]|uniref:hypothetical protein n=1 Tax=Streptomyces sp. NPDC015184 TaxID=3364946 RepID=UPI0036F56FAC